MKVVRYTILSLRMKKLFLTLCLFFQFLLYSDVRVGVDLFLENSLHLLKGKKVGLITNQSAVNKDLYTTFDLLRRNAKEYILAGVFTPEHGYYGDAYAWEKIDHHHKEGIPFYSLHGECRRPTKEMLKQIDVLVYDIQDIGSRSYTFLSTLFYCMEEAAKNRIPFIVFDRPNPMGGVVVDGLLTEEKWRSFLGYINIPYCHGMTIGELAKLFNCEYKVGCQLTVISMEGWKRGMCFSDTKLPWVPTSPQIPEPDTPFYYPTTGIIGHFSLASIGVGYTLPFKLIGAPWIQAEAFAMALNEHNLPGVFFQPYYFRPFFGKFKLENCQGVRVVVTDSSQFLPFTTQITIMGVIKNLYPHHFEKSLGQMIASANKKDVFNKLNGTEKVLEILSNERYVIWKLRELCLQARKQFQPIREKYLDPAYQ